MNPVILKPRLSPSMFFILLLVSLTGLDYLMSPYDAAQAAGPSGYWTVAGALLLILPYIWLILRFKNRFPGDNLLQAAPRVIGKPLALVGNLAFLSTFLVWLVVFIPNATYLLSTYLLDRTPRLVILISLLASIGYVAINGLKAVARMAAFVFIPTLIFTLFMKLISFENITTTYLLPLFSSRPLDYLQGAASIANL